jgi:hypothetical protein
MNIIDLVYIADVIKKLVIAKKCMCAQKNKLIMNFF